MQNNDMIDVATIAQAVAVISACWVIISGVGAWKREYIGKRQIEIAEQALAKFFEVSDAIAFIRNPFASSEEGKTRKRNEHELSTESELLDRGYIVVERYGKKENIFLEFNTLKYKFMATFGSDNKDIFTDTNKILNSIFSSARLLATHYWPRQGRLPMGGDEFKKHLEDMSRHEGIFWDVLNDDDEIRRKLKEIQDRLDRVTAPCFNESMKTYSLFTRKWFNKNG